MDRLKGKIILINGGARGQGAAEARLFVAEGGRVVIGDVLEAEGLRLASELGEAAVFVAQDVTRRQTGTRRSARQWRWEDCTAWSTMPAFTSLVH